MNWVAAGGVTFVAACVIYKISLVALQAYNGGQNADPTWTTGKDEPEQLGDKNIPNGAAVSDHQDTDVKPPTVSAAPSAVTLQEISVHKVKQESPPTARVEVPSAPSIMALPNRPASPPRLKPPTFGSMPAPPRPVNGLRVRPPPSAASSLRVPVTRVLANTSMAPSSLMPPPNKPSRQVALQPGHSPLDWAMLTSNPNHKLRGKDVPENLLRVTPSQLKYHSGRKGKDAWTVYQGRVYNITPYLPFHPGGEDELMRGAGREAGKLFMEVHPWVNWDGMLGECLVGILVGEGEDRVAETNTSGGLDDMD